MIKKRIVRVMLILSVLFAAAGNSFVCLAGEPMVAQIGSDTDFLNWYNSEAVNENARLTGDIVIHTSLEMGITQGNKTLDTGGFTIHIAPGTKLTLNNPMLHMRGDKEVITAENGSELSLIQGGISNKEDSNALLIKTGGNLKVSPQFNVEGKIDDRNKMPETTSAVVVQNKPLIRIESAVIMSTDMDGTDLIRVTLPPLPEEAAGLYLYYSADQVKYTMASWPWQGGEYTNYLDHYIRGGSSAVNDFITFHYKTMGRPLWVKVEMKVNAGAAVTSVMSRPVKCLGYGGSGSSIQSQDDDRSPGGNTGVGGQGTWGREEIYAGSNFGGPGVSPAGSGGGVSPAGLGEGGSGSNESGRSANNAEGAGPAGSVEGAALPNPPPAPAEAPAPPPVPGTLPAPASSKEPEAGEDESRSLSSAPDENSREPGSDAGSTREETAPAHENAPDFTREPDAGKIRDKGMKQYAPAIAVLVVVLILASLVFVRFRKRRKG